MAVMVGVMGPRSGRRRVLVTVDWAEVEAATARAMARVWVSILVGCGDVMWLRERLVVALVCR